MLADQFHSAASRARTTASLDETARLLWRAHAEAQIPDAEAGAISEVIEARRAALVGKDPAKLTVPEDALARPLVSPEDTPPDSPPDSPVLAQIARLEGELVGMREALAEARGRAAAAEARAEAAETRASEESAKMAQAIAAFQSLAERLEAIAEARKPW
jgi:hypothetical protein